MPENEFERKVQERMEELRIRPSEETWVKVEKELREKKKRRTAILVFFMAGLLLLGYSGYTFLYKSSNQPVAQNEIKKSSAETIQPSNHTPTITTNNTTNNKSAVAENPGITPITNQADQSKVSNPSIKPETVKENPVTTENLGPKNKGQLSTKVITGQTEETTIVKAKTVVPMQQENRVTNQTEKNLLISHPGETDIIKNNVGQTEQYPVQKSTDKKEVIISNGIASDPINDKQQMPVDSATRIDSPIAKAQDAPVTEETKPVIGKNKSKIRFGVEVSGGIISSQDKVFGLKIGSEYKVENLQPGYPGSISGGTNAPRPIPPSAVKAGKALKIGLIAEKTISKRSSLSVGLRYSYADESVTVGSRRDTVIRSNSYSISQNFLAFSDVRNAYSASAPSAAAPQKATNYTNRYHFLEIPLLYQAQLNKGKKMGILWNAGISPGFLIGTNALVYDTVARGIYYQNDRAFKRFHINMETGFALQFGNNKKIQWSLGPTVSLDMTRLMKEDVFTEKRYFLYTGLTSRLFLNSRKK